MYAKGCMKELRRVSYLGGNVLDGLVAARMRQGCPLSPVLYSVYVMEMLGFGGKKG